jgi:hypothetical protein
VTFTTSAASLGTVKQDSIRLGLSTPEVYQLCRAGYIRCFPIGLKGGAVCLAIAEVDGA